MCSSFCLQGIQPSSLPSCPALCWMLHTHYSLAHPISTRGQGNFCPKARKLVEGPKAHVTYRGPWSPNCEDYPTLTRCPRLPKAGKGSFLDLSVIPRIPTRLCSVWMGHRVPCRVNSLLHCCGPRCLPGAWQRNRRVRSPSSLAGILEGKTLPWPPTGDQPPCRRGKFRAHLSTCWKPLDLASRVAVGAGALPGGGPSKHQWQQGVKRLQPGNS